MPPTPSPRKQVGAVVSYEVRPLDKDVARDMVLREHYSGRCPGIRESFALWEGGQLVGCVVYSIPASYTLCNGVCGETYRKQVLELARLVVMTPSHNAASSLVGRSLALLGDQVVVSYADCNDHVGHVGYVYQSTNWMYSGRSSAEPVYVLEADHPNGMKTGTPVSYTRRHIDQKARDLGFDWGHNASIGPGLVRLPSVGKHRYVYFTGSKRFVQAVRLALRYKVLVKSADGKEIWAGASLDLFREIKAGRLRLTYPKGATRRHNKCAMEVGNRRAVVVPPSESKPLGPTLLEG